MIDALWKNGRSWWSMDEGRRKRYFWAIRQLPKFRGPLESGPRGPRQSNKQNKTQIGSESDRHGLGPCAATSNSCAWGKSPRKIPPYSRQSKVARFDQAKLACVIEVTKNKAQFLDRGRFAQNCPMVKMNNNPLVES